MPSVIQRTRSSFNAPLHTTASQKATARPGIRHRRAGEPQRTSDVVVSVSLWDSVSLWCHR